jgi:hypothetical protein
MVDEHVAHRARGHREEVGAARPLPVAQLGQAQVRLVDERRRLEGMLAALAAEEP